MNIPTYVIPILVLGGMFAGLLLAGALACMASTRNNPGIPPGGTHPVQGQPRFRATAPPEPHRYNYTKGLEELWD